jgi:hypothetical protein
MDLDIAMQTTLAESRADLDCEIASYGNAKGALKTYLQHQFKSRKLLYEGKYSNIPVGSRFRSNAKPYRLRMNPKPEPGIAITTNTCIGYLKALLYEMISEDNKHQREATAQPEDTKLIRNLPVISEIFLNPRSTHLKKLQESAVAAMAKPKDNPWYSLLAQEYLGKILWDGGFFRIFAIQFNANKGRNVFPCWEATTEPVFKDDDGSYIVHPRHLVTMDDGSTKLLKSAEVGFALAEYSLGDDLEPVKLTFADQCHAKFLQRDARQPAPAQRKRRQPAPTQEVSLASTTASIRKRPQPAHAKEHQPSSRRSSRLRST